MEAVTIKPMLPEYWEQVKQIYESGIATGNATFETTAPSWEKWNEGHLTFARLVAMENNQIVDWAALIPVSNRCVYGGVVEVSVYVAANFQGKGIGKKLLQNQIIESEGNGIWTLQAGVFTNNVASMKILKELGLKL